MPPQAVSVVLAEDSYLVREGIQRLLELEEGVSVLDDCGDLDALRSAIEAHRPDVVVTDIRMPPTSTDEGVRIAAELRDSHPEMGVVVLSQFADAGYALALLERGSGRRAYLLKERVSEPEQLVGAIREVARGGSMIDPLVVEGLVAARSRAARSPLAELTQREGEVLAEMARGRSNAAIGGVLDLTERAVEKHINAIFSKLQLSEEPDVNRRVRAVLLYLAERSE
ncbi:MAG: response regulator [Candidatus Dormibacteria bacterium]